MFWQSRQAGDLLILLVKDPALLHGELCGIGKTFSVWSAPRAEAPARFSFNASLLPTKTSFARYRFSITSSVDLQSAGQGESESLWRFGSHSQYVAGQLLGLGDHAQLRGLSLHRFRVVRFASGGSGSLKEFRSLHIIPFQRERPPTCGELSCVVKLSCPVGACAPWLFDPWRRPRLRAPCRPRRSRSSDRW